MPSVQKYSKSKRLLSRLWFRLMLLLVFKKKAKKKQGSVVNMELKVSFTVSKLKDAVGRYRSRCGKVFLKTLIVCV